MHIVVCAETRYSAQKQGTVRRIKKQEVNKICYDNTTEEKEMRDRFFRVLEHFLKMPDEFFGSSLKSKQQRKERWR